MGAASRAAPHEPQNRKPGGFGSPQFGQAGESVVPQDPQNFCDGPFWAPQFGHARVVVKAVLSARESSQRHGSDSRALLQPVW
jgi:hypothetical protein